MMQFLLPLFAAASFPVAALVISYLVSRDVDRIVQKAQQRTRFGNSATER